MRLRAFLYTTFILKSHTFSVPIISVGNLTMGGSGKTPIVIYLARFLKQQGYRPAVISRGYGGKATAAVNVVSDGEILFLDSAMAGDEPRLIAEKARGTAVLTGKKRKYPCRYAVDKLGCNVIILDDGFQHLSVNRNIDLVLFNATTNFKLMHVLPSGILRESFSALNRANAFIITGCSPNNLSQTQEIVSYLHRGILNKPSFKLNYTPIHYVDFHGNIVKLDALSTRVFAFCGIASPYRFIHTIKEISVDIAEFANLSDHQQYSQELLSNIINQAKKHGARALLTTEKDLVKLKSFDSDLPIYALCMEVDSSPSFETYIMNEMASYS